MEKTYIIIEKSKYEIIINNATIEQCERALNELKAKEILAEKGTLSNFGNYGLSSPKD